MSLFAFVLGNGVSRQGIDLTQLRQSGPIYGCNALYREFTPDVLVATDRPIATRIQESGYSAQHRFYTRRPLPNLGAQPVPTVYYSNSSGPIACALAALDHHQEIYLLGFDLGPTTAQQFNNLYAGTEFYKDTGSKPTYTGNWIRQLTKISQDFATTKFYRVCGDTTAEISEFDAILNFRHLDMHQFRQQFAC
jgi:hypothetical protein